jgi:hypothetical protein
MSKETTMNMQMLDRQVTSSRGRRMLLAGLVAASCLLLIALAPSRALAAFSVVSFDGSTVNADGTMATQAGSHPFSSTTTFSFPSLTDGSGAFAGPDGNMKDVQVGLPAGFIGDPNATPKCTVADLDANNCSGATQVGSLTLAGGTLLSLTLPVFNMVPPRGVTAQFGANVLLVDAFIDISVRTGGDYGLTAGLVNIPTILPLTGSSLTLWGVPADPAHDADRHCPGFVTPCTAGIPLKPLLTLPTQCSGPLTYTLRADSWQNPGSFITSSFTTHDSSGNPVGINGCAALSFNPSISVGLGNSAANSPTALSVDLHVPQAPDVPGSLATPSVKNAVVTLPPGIQLSPSAGDGLQACSQDQFGLSNAAEPACPDASKLGTAEIDSPISPDPLTGSIYLAQQHNNPFGSNFAMYVATEADGTLIKLAARIDANPLTGQLTTTFNNNPQLPFSDFKLNFFGGPRAVLATGGACGTFPVTSDVQPWSTPASGPDAQPTASVSISSGCVGGFHPTFTAGMVNPQGGSFSPFVLSFSRGDGDQNVSGLSVSLPPGFSAKLAGVAECSAAQLAHAQANSGAAELASPSCPAGSQVGTAKTGAGPGSNPFFLSGKVYLTGPYKGAPFGLAVVVPAVAGPLDLGTVVVRQTLNIDPTDAHVTVVSDPFPTILQGIPLQLRRVDVVLNRSKFTVAPTSCSASQIKGSLTSTLGATAPVASRFQVGGCQSLGFAPKLKLSLTGKGKTKSGNHPTLLANLTTKSGQANIDLAKVTLPLSLALDPQNSKVVCPFATAKAVHGGAVGCKANTIVGKVTATTPLLSKPLTGKVYLVQGIRISHGQQIRTLPTLLIPLRGQIALDLRAATSVNGKGALVNTFSNVPDVPVSSFKLQINGGSKGILVITGRGRNICNATQTSAATLNAHSGKQENMSIKLATPCKG